MHSGIKFISMATLIKLTAVSLTVVSLTVGCTATDSEDVRTSGLFADFTAVSDGQDTTIKAILRVGGEASNNRLELSDGDSLSVFNEATTQPMFFQRGPLGGIEYVAGFVDDLPGTRYTIAFERTVDGDAPQSVAELPADFMVDALNNQYQYNEDITLTWSPNVPLMEITAYGDCIKLYHRRDIQNASSYTLTAGSLEKNKLTESSQCEVTVQLDSINNGTVDANFGEGGKFRAIQRRKVKFLIQLPLNE